MCQDKFISLNKGRAIGIITKMMTKTLTPPYANIAQTPTMAMTALSCFFLPVSLNKNSAIFFAAPLSSITFPKIVPSRNIRKNFMAKDENPFMKAPFKPSSKFSLEKRSTIIEAMGAIIIMLQPLNARITRKAKPRIIPIMLST